MIKFAIIAYLIAAPIGAMFLFAACTLAKWADNTMDRYHAANDDIDVATCRGCGKFTCNCLPAE